ncbi:MAG: phosphotransferase [Pseudomonadota bacterium]
MSGLNQISVTYSTASAVDLLKFVSDEYALNSPLRCRFWTRGANDTYLIYCADARYSLRVYRHDTFTREAVEFEAEVLNHLHSQGSGVARPVARRSGGSVAEIQMPEGCRFVLLSTFAEGSAPDYKLPNNCRAVGESVAWLHTHTDNFHTALRRPDLDLATLLDDSLQIIRPYIDGRPADLELIEQMAATAHETVQSMVADKPDVGVCHGDLHGGNLHMHNGAVTHYDFEECAVGFRAYDLATFKWGVCMGRKRTDRWLAFLQGYESVRPIADCDRALINPFVVIRDLSNIAYGMRHVADFGHVLIDDAEIDDDCRQLREIQQWLFE